MKSETVIDKETKEEVKAKEEDKKIDCEPEYIIIGPPGHGKSTYAITLADRLIRYAGNENPEFRVFLDQETMNYVDEWVSSLNKGNGFPTKNFETKQVNFSFEDNSRFFVNKGQIQLLDYPGEAYYTAFTDQKNQLYEEQAQKLLSEIQKAKGIFLVIDMAELHDSKAKLLSNSLFKLIEFINKGRNKPKLAIIFSKKDLFESLDEKINPVAILQNDYPNIWNLLQAFEKGRVAFFESAAVSETAVDSEGKIQPIKGYQTKKHSIHILEPFLWMFGMTEPTMLETVVQHYRDVQAFFWRKIG